MMQGISRLLPATPKGWHYELVYKRIRHIYFRIYPDKRLIRISAPFRISVNALSSAIQAKSAWLIGKMTALKNAPQHFIPLSAMKESASCMVWGRQLPVDRRVCSAHPGIYLSHESGIIIRVPLGFAPQKEENLWNQWLRILLNERIQTLLEKWQPIMGVAPVEVRLKKMKTRWGSCNTVVRRIWINAFLVHLEPCLLEYVLVHELVHLLERGHTLRFYQILEAYLPDWKTIDIRLNKIELRH